jgi:hypothetical protein
MWRFLTLTSQLSPYGMLARLEESNNHHLSPNGESGYSMEVFNAVGDTIAVTAVPESALEQLRKDEVLSVRALAAK